MATYFLDFENGNDANAGTSFALRWKTINSGATAARVVAGDTVRIMASPDPTLVGNATWTQYSRTVTLAAPVTANVSMCDTAWSASANVTAASNTAPRKEGAGAVKVAIAAAFTTGLAAYSTLALSSSIANRTGNVLGAAALTSITLGATDDGNVAIALPFSVNFLGASYTTVYVGSNGYLTFGTGSNAFNGLSASVPGIPGIQINAADRSYQKVYAGSENAGATFRIRYEGASTVTTTSNVFWEVTFTAASPAQVLIDMGANGASGTGVSGITDGVSYQQTFASGTQNTGYTFNTVANSVNLSGYQQISFWLQTDTAIVANTLSLRLCTDSAGATTAHTIALPALSTVNRWVPVTVDLGANMNTAIQTVAVYQDVDIAAVNVTLDNIIACKASSSPDSLSLTSMIGKVWNLNWSASTAYALNDIRKPTAQNRNGYRYKVTVAGTTSATEPSWLEEIGKTIVDGGVTWACEGLEDTWYPVQSINGTAITLDASTDSDPTTSRGYAGTTETVATYRRESIRFTPIYAQFTQNFAFQNSGTVGNNITYSGGWNRTDMSTKTGETWIDGQTGYSYGFNASNTPRSYLTLDNLGAIRFYLALQIDGQSGSTVTNYHGSNSTYGIDIGVGTNLPLLITKGLNLSNNNGSGLSNVKQIKITAVTANNNTNQGVYNSGVRTVLDTLNVVAKNNGSFGFVTNNPSAGVPRHSGLITANNGSAGLYVVDSDMQLFNCSLTDATPLSTSSAFGNNYIYSTKHNQIADNHYILTDGGTIISATDQRHTASGISWKFRPTSTTRSNIYPLKLSVAKIACAAGTPVNVTIWTYRDNANIFGTLKVAGGQIAGVPLAVTVSCAPTINTWVQSTTLTFTPSEVGVVEITFEVYDGVGTTNNFWIDDLAVS